MSLQLLALAIYNRATAKAKPNPEYMALLSAKARAEYLEDLRPRREVPDRWDDPWFRYIDEGDVVAWMEFLASAMPTILLRFVASEDQVRAG